MLNRKSDLSNSRSTDSSNISGHAKYTFTKEEELGVNTASIGSDPDGPIQKTDSEFESLELSMSDSEFIIPGIEGKKMTFVKDKLMQIDGVYKININQTAQKLIISHDLQIIRPRRLIQEIQNLGHAVTFEKCTPKADIRGLVKNKNN